MVYRSDGEEDLRGALARFVLTDFNAIREQAYKLAVANARAKAEPWLVSIRSSSTG